MKLPRSILVVFLTVIGPVTIFGSDEIAVNPQQVSDRCETCAISPSPTQYAAKMFGTLVESHEGNISFIRPTSDGQETPSDSMDIFAFPTGEFQSGTESACQASMTLNCPPSADAQSFIDNLNLQINGVISAPAPCPAVARIEWNWGDSAVNDSWFPAQHTYSTSGDYTISATALDSSGLVLAQRSCNLQIGSVAYIPQPPWGTEIQAGHSGSWYTPSQNNTGVFFEVLDDPQSPPPYKQIWMSWFAFSEHEQVWIVASGYVSGAPGIVGGQMAELDGYIYEGNDFPPHYDPGLTISKKWGSIFVWFDGCDKMLMRWDSLIDEFGHPTAGPDGEVVLHRLTQIAGTSCNSNPSSGVRINAFYADPVKLQPQQYTVLHWDVSNASRCDPELGANTLWPTTVINLPTGDAVIVPPSNGTHRFGLTCTDGTSSESKTVSVEVISGPSDLSIDAFSAWPASIQAGQSTTISWTVSNATSCLADGNYPAWNATSIGLPSGQMNLNFNSPGNYTLILICTNGVASVAENVVINVSSQASVTVLFDNRLLHRITVFQNGTALGSVPPASTAQETLAVNLGDIFSFEVNQSDGDSMRGEYPPVQSTANQLNYKADWKIGSQYYFVPVIHNNTPNNLTIGVNMGLQSENRCYCYVSAYSTAQGGYYKLFSNSNLRLYDRQDYTGNYWFWENFSQNVQAETGRIDFTRN